VTSPTTTEKRCSKCGVLKPRTSDFFYFDYAGRVTGYCRPCHALVNRSYVLSAEQRTMHREVGRNWWRRHRRPPPERQRGLRVEAAS